MVDPSVDGLEHQGDAGTRDVGDSLGEDLDQLIQLILPLAAAEARAAADHDPGAAQLLRNVDAGVQPGEERLVVLRRDHELHPGLGQLGDQLYAGLG